MDPISIAIMAGMFGVMYFFFIRPQQKQAQLAKEFQASLDKGARVVTTGGIHGKIIKAEENAVLLEIANNVKIRIEKSGISMEMSKAAYGEGEKKADAVAVK